MKRCFGCNQEKELALFSRNRSKKDGLQSRCKACQLAASAAWQKANPEKVSTRSKKWREKFPERHSGCFKTWHSENSEAINQKRREDYEDKKEMFNARSNAWKAANPDAVNAFIAKRRSSKLQRTPAWLTAEDLKLMRKIYRDCSKISRETGIPHHVDHILPLCGTLVSGLHVPSNLQILTASENSRKKNRWTPE